MIVINRAVMLLTFIFLIGVACSSVCDNYANTEDDCIDNRDVAFVEQDHRKVPIPESVLENRKKSMIRTLCKTNNMAENISKTLKNQED